MKELTLAQLAAWCGAPLCAEQENITVRGVSIDSRTVKPGDLFIALRGEHTDGHAFLDQAAKAGAAAALVTENVQSELPCLTVDDTLAAFGKIAAGYRRLLGVRVIGITGSVGKTTTKEMTACALETTLSTVKSEANYNNNLGLPLSIMRIEEDTEVAVLELGMNHFGEMTYLSEMAAPDIAVITNIGTMHIEHLGSREGILQAKLEILRGLQKDGVCVFNGDEPLLWNIRGSGSHTKYYYGIENAACDVVAEGIQELEDGMRFHVTGFGHSFEMFVPVLGRHVVYNSLAAITSALLLKIKPETLQSQLDGFRNTGMRQKIYDHNGIRIIEDCYNAGPESMEAALNVLESIRTEGRRIAVLGDMLELGNRSSAEHYRIGRLCALKADMVLTYGAHSRRTMIGAITGGMNPRYAQHFDTHEELVRILKLRAKEGDVLLFKGSHGMKMERALQMFLAEET